MDQIRIAADSSCDLLTMDGVDFVSVPLTVRTAVEEFRDDAALNVDAMVTTLRGTKGRTFSACPNIADWESAFGESGDVLAFTITSSLSGSCSAALAAKKRCEEQNPSRCIFVVDTLSAGPEIALLIEKSAAELRSGKSFEEVCTAVQQYQRRTHLLFALESMHNLAQNGRISKLAATMAGVLGIRAVGQASEEGTLEMLGKCRGARKTQELLLSEMVRLGYRGGDFRGRRRKAIPCAGCAATMQNTAGLCWALRHENEGLGQEGAAASCGTHSDTAAHRHRGNAASDVRSGRASDAQGAAAVRGVPAGDPIGGVPAAGDLPHWKGPAQGAARHGAGMQRRWVSVRVSLVNADAMLLARPYPVSLLCHFHRGAVAA